MLKSVVKHTMDPAIPHYVDTQIEFQNLHSRGRRRSCRRNAHSRRRGALAATSFESTASRRWMRRCES